MADTTQVPPTFDDIRAILGALSEEIAETTRQQQETERRQQETERLMSERSREADRRQQELDRFLKEQRQEADRRQQELDLFLKEHIQETRRREKALDKRLDKRINQMKGVFTSQWGELVESLVQGGLVALMRKRRMTVDSIHQRVYGRRNGEDYEFDIVAGNGDEVVVVEVKTTLRSEDVTHFLDKLRRFTVYEPRYRGERIYGAVAYLKADVTVTKYAERHGLFVIRATGDSASIINAEDFKPAVFS